MQTINLTVEEEEESPKQQALSSQGTVKQKTAAPKNAASAPKTAAQAAPATKVAPVLPFDLHVYRDWETDRKSVV